MSARLSAFVFLLCALLFSGCGIYQDYPTGHLTPWPLVQVEGEGHERPRALVIRRILDASGGGHRLNLVHDEVVGSGLFSSVQTRASETQSRPGYDYILEFSLSSRDNYEWYAYLGLIPGFPIFSEEIYTLTCTVYDGEKERLGEVEHSVEMDQALGLILLPWNIIYTILPGRFSPYDLLSSGDREALMIRAMTRDLLMLANERFDFRPPELLSEEEKKEAQRKSARKLAEQGLSHLNSDELKEAEQSFAQALKADPTYENAWYNLACTYARMGKLDAAEEAFGYAIEAGYDDFEHAEKDKDFDPLRDRPGFQRLLEGLAKQKNAEQPSPTEEDSGDEKDSGEEDSGGGDPPSEGGE
jgi:tetratricopeptide repeat protein